MTAYIIVSLVAGILFGVMDGLINANPLARKLYEIFRPIARDSVNFVAGILIDLAYGFILAGLFLLLYSSLPGQTELVKGLSFGVGVWFLRVVMGVASQWMMYKLPAKTLVYSLLAGLGEMLVLGCLFGLALHPAG
jgi:hypothetical protein